MKHDVSAEVIFPEGTKFLQFVADNTDHDMAALNGGGTHHVMGSITIVNCGYVSATCPAHRVPRDRKGNWSEIKSCEGMLIHSISILAFTDGIGRNLIPSRR